MEVKVESLGKVCVTVDKDYWSSEKSYDKLVIVEVAGVGTFISRKPVPARTNINDRIYWIPITVNGGGGGTIPISQDFGDSETITISQKTLTEKVNSLQDKGGYVRFDQNQSESLTEEQKAIARHNIGAEDAITVDSELSDTSVNPVQNKVVKAAIDNIQGGADKEYNPAEFSGLGKVYLKKNIVEVGGVEKNILTQSAFYKDGPNQTRVPNTDTVFVIQYDFDLNGETINIPAGCALDFEGGKIYTSVEEGKIVGNDTAIIAPIKQIFGNNVLFDGRWAVSEVYSEWFGAKTDDNSFDSTDAIQKAVEFSTNSYGKVLRFLQGLYYFDQIVLDFKVSVKGSGIGCTILRQNSSFDGHAIDIPSYCNCFRIEDFTLIGNGNGEYDGIHFADNDDWNKGGVRYAKQEIKGFVSDGSAYRYSYINNVLVSNFGGNGLYLGTKQYCLFVENSHFRDNNRCGIVLKATDSTINNCYCEYNHLTGLDILGSNNKISNVKSIWNGKDNPKDSNAFSVNSRNQLVNCESQDNYCRGYYIYGDDNTFVNCMSNNDCYFSEDKVYNPSMSPRAIMIDRNADNNNFVGCKITTYNYAYGSLLETPFYLGGDLGRYDVTKIFDGVDISCEPDRSLFRTYTSYYENGINSHEFTGSFEIQDARFIKTDGSAYLDLSKDNIMIKNGTTIYISFKIRDITHIVGNSKPLIRFMSSSNENKGINAAIFGCDFSLENPGKHQLYFWINEANKSIHPANINNADYDVESDNALITIAFRYYNNNLYARGYYPRMSTYEDEQTHTMEYAYFSASETIVTPSIPFTGIVLTDQILLEKLIISYDEIEGSYLVPGAPMRKFRKASPLYIIGTNYQSLFKTCGTTEERPNLSGMNNGFLYFDTTIGKLIVYYANAWHNVDGTNIVE